MCIRDRSFSLNGKRVRIASGQFHPRTTLLDYLRENTPYSGTKASCAQGGCGACNVVLVTQDRDGAPQYRSINACLKPLLSLDGAAVLTTEGIGSCNKGYHPIQERIAGYNGVQCGFCTPGHVMSMYALLRETGGENLSAQEIESRFDGNICRCTGYRAIMTAMNTFASEPGERYSESINGLPDKGVMGYDPSCEPAAPPLEPSSAFQSSAPDGAEWCTVKSISELTARLECAEVETKMVVGHTSVGVYPDQPHERGTGPVRPMRYIDISTLPELNRVELTDQGLLVGAAVSISDLQKALTEHSERSAESFPALAEHLALVGNWQVRNAGSWAGNLCMTKRFGFASDLSTILMAAGARLSSISPGSEDAHECTAGEFFSEGFGLAGQLITHMVVPFNAERERLLTFRQALRTVNAHALLNAGFRVTMGADNTIQQCSLVLGAVDARGPISLPEVEKYLTGKQVNAECLQGALELLRPLKLHPELQYHTTTQPEGKDKYRAELLESCMFMLLSQLVSTAENPGDPRSALKHRPAGSGTQMWLTDLPEDHPGKHPFPKQDAVQLASGEGKYANDVPNSVDTLYAAYVSCRQAPARIVAVPSETALSMPGVEFFVDATTGDFDLSQASYVRGEEPLFAAVGDVSLHVGQGIAMVVAKTRREAEEAAAVAASEVAYEAVDGSSGVYGIDTAVALAESEAPSSDQHLVLQEMRDLAHHWPNSGATGTSVHGHVSVGDVDSIWNDCASVAEGEVMLGGQSHFSIEKHSSTAVPEEGGRYVVFASTQQPDDTHIRVAALLGLSKDKVTVRNKRCGGAFGSRCTKSYHVSCAAALCARVAGAPVKVQNSIGVDMHMGGNCRDPMLVKFKVGCDAEGRILGCDLSVAQDQGCATDYSDFVVEEVMFNVEGPYAIPNFRNKVTPHRTNTASNTAFRGPGLVEAAGISENIMEAMAAKHGMDPTAFRLKNLMTPENAITCLQAKVPEYNVHKVVEHILHKANFDERKSAVDEFNATHKWTKRGIALMPLRFAHTQGFSQGQTVLVNVSASDGSVSAWTTGCEIGQGLFAKVAGTISQKLGVPLSKVSVMEVNTQVTPNAMITGGSTTSECCSQAAADACTVLLARLAPVREHMNKENGKQPTWEQLCSFANTSTPDGVGAGLFTPDALHVNLSAAATYQPKGRSPEELLGGSSMSNNLNNTTTGHGITDYFSTGASVTEVEIDLLTGAKTILRADLVQDCGHSLNPQIDIGQCEGGYVIGLGFYLQEEVMIDKATGHNNSHDTWEYKPCLNRDIPIEFNVELLPDAPFGADISVRGSKAIGEPPVLLALSAFTAIRYAISASRQQRGKSAEFTLQMPATVDRVHQALEMDPADFEF
eukprot:TRINITY_DN9019_c0_g1_i2.p1 TRINITY_DN9019_c0_g1~~TRINITY_DN9019_c0_g1_i2.p1  ORF type:complete len:1365 (-),score=314.97 TRINITY_DN9019_c0_g1_i2:152-4246(-)